MRAKTLKDAEELRRKQVASQAKPIENDSDEENVVARRARSLARRRCAKRRVAEIEAELEALGDTLATGTGGASSPPRPSTPEGIPDSWRKVGRLVDGLGRRLWHQCNVISPVTTRSLLL